jgi:hypothetical protein
LAGTSSMEWRAKISPLQGQRSSNKYPRSGDDLI